MRAAVVIAAGAFPLTLGCSSVPDVQFLDVIEAGASSSSGSVSGDSGAKPPEGYRCPDNPPPPGEGICCGTAFCVKCKANQCDRCARLGCGTDLPCCALNAGLVECLAQSQCK